MNETANFGLKKPEENEFYDVNVQNDNMDEVDRVLQEFKDGTQQVGDSAKLGGKGASEYIATDGGDIDGLVKFLYGGKGEMFMFTHTLGGRLRYLKGKDENGNEIFADIVLSDEAVKFMTQNNGVTNTREILHTGNKPTGTYTGNGSATARNIEIGGIGEVLVVSVQKSSGIYGVSIITKQCALVADETGAKVEPFALFGLYAGKLSLATSNPNLNAEGFTYNYWAI